MKLKPPPLTSVHDLEMAQRCAMGRVVLIDDDFDLLRAFAALIEMEGYACETHASAEAYLQVLNYNQPSFDGPCCVLSDVMMPGLGGLALQARLNERDDTPLLLMSGASAAQEVVHAYHAGALDFLIKPIEANVLLDAIARAMEVSRSRQEQHQREFDIAQRVAALTATEREVARRVARGQINQDIADEMTISLRTVKLHRHRALLKLQVETVVELARLADEAGL